METKIFKVMGDSEPVAVIFSQGRDMESVDDLYEFLVDRMSVYCVVKLWMKFKKEFGDDEQREVKHLLKEALGEMK